MPTIRRSRVVAAPPEEVWRVLADPWHLPRWWPRVERVEGVDGDGWTSVMRSDRGRAVRADYRVTVSEPPRRRVWEQELEGTPFEGLLRAAVTVAEVAPEGDGAARVTLVLIQRLRGLSRMAGWLFRRAGRRQLDEALAGLGRVCGE